MLYEVITAFLLEGEGALIVHGAIDGGKGLYGLLHGGGGGFQGFGRRFRGGYLVRFDAGRARLGRSSLSGFRAVPLDAPGRGFFRRGFPGGLGGPVVGSAAALRFQKLV